jgi:hypothetical protein
MRWLKVTVPLAALVVFAAQVANANVPSFVRQTGLTCNQCHMTWTPNPDMTFTGTKFRLNGYRTPWVAEKIEAGEEGALNGRRLVLGVDGYLSYHMRSQILAQSKPGSNPSGPEAEAGAVESQPFQSLAWDFTGPITENVGIWTEWYSTSCDGCEEDSPGNSYGTVANDEYDVKIVFNPGDGGNIIGFSMNNQPRTSPFFGAFGSGVASSQGNTVNVGFHAWLRDRVAIDFKVIPGQAEAQETSWNYERTNYGLTAAILPMNTDAMWLMFTGAFLVGNDLNPIANVTGVSALRTGPRAGSNYVAYELGDAKRLLVDMRFGALDRGSWSWNSATAISIEDETYVDGAKAANRAFATSWRIFYERTYGLLFNVGKRMSYTYTDPSGVEYDIPNDLSYGAGLVFRQAMNLAWELQYSNSQQLRVGENWRNGWSWVLRLHYLY